MILRLVDRLPASGEAVIAEAMWTQLQSLVGGIGVADWLVDVVMVSDEAMAKLNQEFREKDGVTDILSFSYLLAEGEGRASCEADEHYALHDVWRASEPELADGANAVGELILAPEFIATRSLAHGWPWASEIPMLVVHGCLHLLGWDHEESAELTAMQNIESEILAMVGLDHPLRKRS